MKLKRVLICVPVIAALLLTGCGKQEPVPVETEPDREIDIYLSDAYGVIAVTEEDMEGNLVTGDYNGISVLGAAGEPMGNCFAEFHSITPVLEGDSFEGWMECRYDDELGNYTIVSDRLYSTEELMAMPVPEAPVEYVVKWASIPAEEYFAMDESEVFEDSSTSGFFTLCGNGGEMQFQNSYGDYTSVGYGYGVGEGQCLNDVMGSEYGNDPFLGITKEGAQFTGWTVYMTENIAWSDQPSEEEHVLSLVYDENGFDGIEYVLLENAAVVSENMSTEELFNMPRLGNNYLAMANWEAPAAAQTGPSLFAFSGNGGSIHFFNSDGEEYQTVAFGYALEYGQALNDVMGTEYGDALIGVTRDGAEFMGWTLYVADEITWSHEEIYDTEVLCLLYNDSKPEYALLKNGALVGEYMPTEQLCGMTTYGENYLAFAIWSE